MPRESILMSTQVSVHNTQEVFPGDNDRPGKVYGQ
jgi:hypothetical protein